MAVGEAQRMDNAWALAESGGAVFDVKKNIAVRNNLLSQAQRDITFESKALQKAVQRS